MKSQTRPFQAVITDDMKRGAVELKLANGCEYGWFFSTSGKLCFERENKTKQYNYVWSTHKETK